MSGRISAAVNGFARGLVSAFTDTCFMLVRPLCTLIVSFAIIAAFSPALSLSLLALNIPYFFAVYKVNRRFFTLSNDKTKAENKARGILVDSIANAGLVKYSGSFFTDSCISTNISKRSTACTPRRENTRLFPASPFMPQTRYS